jgi:Invasion associated locus B (IalB) protein
MNARIAGALIVLGLGLWAPAAFAQESPCVSAKTAWSVCLGDQPKECWGVSKPTEKSASRDGQAVTVSRDESFLFVTFRPGTGTKGEISYIGGYPFADGKPVQLDVGGRTFDLIADGEWAWPASASDDTAILAALKAGSTAVVTAVSRRGNQTKDTFSLNGFTAAMTEAEARCK